MRYTPLTWYEQEDLRHRVQHFAQRTVFLRLLASKVISQR